MDEKNESDMGAMLSEERRANPLVFQCMSVRIQMSELDNLEEAATPLPTNNQYNGRKDRYKIMFILK